MNPFRTGDLSVIRHSGETRSVWFEHRLYSKRQHRVAGLMNALGALALLACISLAMPVVAQDNPADTADGETALINQARHWEGKGRYDLANESWLKLLRAMPDHPEALTALGVNEAGAGRRPSAEVYLQRLEESHPGHPGIISIRNALTAGTATQAPQPVVVQDSTTAAPATTSSQEALLNVARKLASDGKYDDAVRAYQKAFNGGEPPNDSVALEYYQTVGGSTGGWDIAAKNLKALADKNPGNAGYQLAYAQHLTYREKARRDGIQLLSKLAAGKSSVAVDARESWRQALIWLGDRKGDEAYYKAYLNRYPKDKRIQTKLTKLRQQNTRVVSKPVAPKVDPMANMVKEGYEALNNGKLEAADRIFSHVLKTDPNNADALGGLGVVRLRQERFDNAINLLEASSRFAPKRADRWNEALSTARYWSIVRRGQAARKAKDLGAAEGYYRKAIPMNPNEVTARVELGDILRELNRFPEAEAEYREILRLEPGNGAALRGLVVSMSEQDRKREALAFAEGLPEDQRELIYNLGSLRGEVLRDTAQAAADRGDYKTAEKLLREALFVDPESPWTRLALARIYQSTGRTHEANSLVDGLLDSPSPMPDALHVKAQIEVDRQNWWSALQALERVPVGSRTPAMADLQRTAWVNYQAGRATALAKEGRIGEARRIVELIEQHSIETPALKASLAQTYAELGDDASALELLRSALGAPGEPDPGQRMQYASLLFKLRQDAEFDVQLKHLIGNPALTESQQLDLARLQVAYGLRQADQLREEGRLTEAYDYLAPLLRVNPNDPRLMMSLARLYNDAGEPARALALYKRVLTTDGQNIDAYKGGINAALAADAHSDAEALLGQALQVDPNNPRFHALAGRLARARGQDDLALQYYRQALTLDAQRNSAEFGSPSWKHSPELFLIDPSADPAYSTPPAPGGAPYGIPRERRNPYISLQSYDGQSGLVKVGNQPEAVKVASEYADRVAQPDERLTPDQIETLNQRGAAQTPVQRVLNRPLNGNTIIFARDIESAPEQDELVKVNGDGTPYPPSRYPVYGTAPQQTQPYGAAPPPSRYPVYGQAPPQQAPVYQQPAPTPSYPQQTGPAPVYRTPAPVVRRPAPIPAPRPSYPTYRDPLLTPAPAPRIARTQRPLDPRDNILREIGDIESERSGYAAGGIGARSRDGEDGLSRLDHVEAPVELGLARFGQGRIKFRATPVFADAGDVNGQEAALFGTNPLSNAATIAAFNEEQSDSGIAVGAVYEQDNFRADIGSTPLGFQIENVVGGVRWQPKSGPWTWAVDLSRRAVTDSLLSWAGTVDTRTGTEWGGVTKTGGRVDLSYDVSEKGGIYGNAGFHAYDGENVESNTSLELGAGFYRKVRETQNSRVTAGVNLTSFFFDKNLRRFTLGHGGYFSPQSYVSIGVPVEWTGRHGATAFRVGGSLGWQTFREDSAPFFPNDSALQAASGGQYGSQRVSGVGVQARADLEHQLTPHVSVGASFRADNATDFTEVSGLGYLRYWFRPQSAIRVPPREHFQDWRQFRQY